MNTLRGKHLARFLPEHGARIAHAAHTSIYYLHTLARQPEYELCGVIGREVQKIVDTMAQGDSAPVANQGESHLMPRKNLNTPEPGRDVYALAGAMLSAINAKTVLTALKLLGGYTLTILAVWLFTCFMLIL